MSLFKLKTIWNVTFPQQQFDQRHIACGLVDKKMAIALGSFKGNLRVYALDGTARNMNNLFKLIYEKAFDQPIIDVKFVFHPNDSIKGNTLGVLMFRKFIYLTLQPSNDPGILSSAKLMNVQVQPSFAIIPSPISLATINFSIQQLNPKQTHQIKQSDSIYPFTMSRENLFYMDGEDLVKTKGTVQQWRIILGRVRSLFLICDVLVVIGQLNLWQVQQGKIIKCKRLEEEVSCGTLAHKPSQDFNIVVCNFLMQMLIYSRDYALLWAVKLDYVPIKVFISENQALKGAMIFLTDQGSIQVTFAGAEIQERTLKPIQQQVNMQRVEKQTQYFLQKLKQLKGNPQQQGNSSQQNNKNKQGINAHELTLKLSFSQPQETTQFVDNSQQFYRSEGTNKLLKCVLTLEMVAQSAQLKNLLINVITPNNIICRNNEINLPVLRGKQFLKFDCFISREKFPYDTQVKVIARYQKEKTTKCLQKHVDIPIAFQCKVDSFEGIQKAEKKITFKCTDNALPSFNQLFPDIMQRGCGQQKKSITFLLVNGIKSSIVYNKNLTKVKIQSEVYSGFCYIFIQFIKRIQSYLQRSKEMLPAVEVQVPLKQLHEQLGDYHSFRQLLRNQYKQLQQKTQQFKKTQKKLLLKMKQKNSSLQHINKLLEFTHGRILQAAEKFEQLQEETNIVNHNFEVGLKFVMQLVYRRSGATQKSRQTAESIIKFDSLNQCIHDDEGWAQRLSKNAAFYLNKRYQPTIQYLEKLVTWVITMVNDGKWNN